METESLDKEKEVTYNETQQDSDTHDKGPESGGHINVICKVLCFVIRP